MRIPHRILYCVLAFAALPLFAQGRGEQIYQSVAARLENHFPDDKGTVWSEGSLDLEEGWLVQSPASLWGASASQLPKTVQCRAGSANCDPQFNRMSCRLPTDCSTGTECRPLEASVYKIGQKPKNLCLGPADYLIDDVYKVMVSAEHELDFVSLAMPSEEFYEAFINALSILSQKPSVPSVRLLFASKNPVSLNIIQTTGRVMDQIVDDVTRMSPGTSDRLKLNLAWLRNVPRISWNHAKIIVADGTYAMTGGHNLWGDTYLKATPLFDLSLIYRGTAATGARDFVNTLWTLTSERAFSSYPESLGQLPPFRLRADDNGRRDTLSVGRLGAYGTNPSDEALRAMIDAAQVSVKISQQDLYNQIRTPKTATFAFDAIIDAAARGVRIEIVQSNKFPLGGYGSVKGDSAYRGFLDALSSRLMYDLGLSRNAARSEACQRIRYASFRFSAAISSWPVNGDPIGNHTKMVLVDDAALYIGSHNLYPANLQEFGTILTQRAATAQFKTQYWDKLWAQSAPNAYACPY